MTSLRALILKGPRYARVLVQKGNAAPMDQLAGGVVNASRPLSKFNSYFFTSSSSDSTPPNDTDKTSEQSGEKDQTEGADVTALLAEKEATIAEMDIKVKALEEKILRTLADMENLRDRSQRQQEDSRKFAVQGFVKGLIDVADNLERATSAVPEEALTDASDVNKTLALLKSLHEGVLMTEKQMLQVFKQNGAEKDETAEGAEFDPNLHMAMFKMPDPSKENNTIATVLKPGYSLHGRVIRPAEVGVVLNS